MKEYIPISEPVLRGNESEYVMDCLQSTWISSSGKYIERFEEGFSEFIGCAFGVSTSNGTTALHLALEALEIGQGDEVIIPNLTFAASINAVLHAGALPVLVDVDEDSWNVSPDEIRKKVTPNTKAIMVVHLYGNPCDMKEIIKIGEDYKLFIVEDCAEAHGATYNNQRVGSAANISCFSFFANKTMTTGEGGMCVTNDAELYEKMKLLRDHGMSKKKKYWHEIIGFNYRMTNIQAAIGCAQLEQLNHMLTRKMSNAEMYEKNLNSELFTFQKSYSNAESISWLVTILLPRGIDRDLVITRLKTGNIDSRPIFYPLNMMPPYQTEEDFPVSKDIAKRGISLPSSVNLTECTIEYISKNLNGIVEEINI